MVYLFPWKHNAGGNIMNTVLINLFVTYMKKQEILYKLTKDEKLHGYNLMKINITVKITPK